SDSATDIFDNHPLWEELDSIEAWISDISTKFGPSYGGLPSLASEFLHRIEIVIDVTRYYLESAVKEAVSKSILDEIKAQLTKIYVELQGAKLEDGSDYDQSLSDANDAVDELLVVLYKLRSDLPASTNAKLTADESERNRTAEYLDKAQSIVDDLAREVELLKEKSADDLDKSRDQLTELSTQVEKVSESFRAEIDDG